MKKLFLHIGLQKTGSTSIQDFLSENRDNLRNHGYLYPQTGIKFSGHDNLAWLTTNSSKYLDPTRGNWQEAHKEIESSSLDNIILSSELFAFANKKQIKNLKSELKPYEVKVIAYLRRQDLRLESQYTQNIKNGLCSTDIFSFIERRKDESDYYKFLEPWKQIFGLTNLIVRPLEKSQIPNIYYDILKAVGINEFEHFNQVESKNIKPGRKAIEILKLANKIYDNSPKKQKEKYVKNIKKCLQKNLPEEDKYRLLSYSDSRKILEEYEQSNQAVAREYLGREDGVLFYEPLEYYENDEFTIEDLSKEELLTLILALSV